MNYFELLYRLSQTWYHGEPGCDAKAIWIQRILGGGLRGVSTLQPAAPMETIRGKILATP
jgi:hypothetical protein